MKDWLWIGLEWIDTGLVGNWQRIGPMLDGDLVLLQRCLPPSRLVFQQHSSNSSNWKVVMELLLALCRPLLRHLALLCWLGTLCWNERLAVDWLGVD